MLYLRCAGILAGSVQHCQSQLFLEENMKRGARMLAAAGTEETSIEDSGPHLFLGETPRTWLARTQRILPANLPNLSSQRTPSCLPEGEKNLFVSVQHL